MAGIKDQCFGVEIEMTGITRNAAARALAADGIVVTGFAPGIVDTPLWRASLGDSPEDRAAAFEAYSTRIPAGRVSTPNDLVPVGIFLSALTLTAAGNAFARWANKPGAIIRVPGIIMLVPGSASLRGLMSMVQQQDMVVGNSALLTVTNIVMALVAGLLFGNLLVPARKNL